MDIANEAIALSRFAPHNDFMPGCCSRQLLAGGPFLACSSVIWENVKLPDGQGCSSKHEQLQWTWPYQSNHDIGDLPHP